MTTRQVPEAVELPPPDPRDSLDRRQAAYFDRIAPSYDDAFSLHPIGKILRADVQVTLEALLPENARVLEIGCGTGHDAVWLAERGHTVVATDVSDEMLRLTEAKTAAHRNRVSVARLDQNDGHAMRQYANADFDVVFANFGALNCAVNLQATLEDCAATLSGKGAIVAVVMGRFCLWETLWFGVRGQLRNASRRWDGSASASGMPVNYFSPREFRDALPGFRVTRLQGIGTFLPPSYLFERLNRRPRLLTTLQKLEIRTRSVASLANVSDHYLVAMERSDS